MSTIRLKSINITINCYITVMLILIHFAWRFVEYHELSRYRIFNVFSYTFAAPRNGCFTSISGRSLLLCIFTLTNCCIQGEATAAGLDDGTGRWTVRPLHPLLHRLRRTPLKLLQETVYLRLYARRRASHRFHRNTENKHCTLPCRIRHFTIQIFTVLIKTYGQSSLRIFRNACLSFMVAPNSSIDPSFTRDLIK